MAQMTQLNLFDYINYLEEQVRNHSIYVFGAQGQGYNVISDNWIRKMETSEKNADRAIKHWHEECDAGYAKVLKAFDCSGLGMYWLMKHMAIIDMNANTMYNVLCDPITKDQLKKGDWVFKKDATGKKTHVGYIVDSSMRVIEAQGRDAGVVKRELNANKWSAYGRPKMFKRDIEKSSVWIATRPLHLETPRMKGEDVAELQRQLIKRGYSCGPWADDGSYGPATEEAVRQLQADSNGALVVDGRAGRKTLTYMGAICKW